MSAEGQSLQKGATFKNGLYCVVYKIDFAVPYAGVSIYASFTWGHSM